MEFDTNRSLRPKGLARCLARNGQLMSLLAIVTSATSCAPGDVLDQRVPPDVASAMEALWSRPDVDLWPTGHIAVCVQPHPHGDQPGTSAWDTAVGAARSTIEEAYENVPRADISFTGWGLCDGWQDFRVPDRPSGALRLIIHSRPHQDGTSKLVSLCPPGYEFGEWSVIGDSCAGFGYATDREPVIYWRSTHPCAGRRLLKSVAHALGFNNELNRTIDGGCSRAGNIVEDGDLYTDYDTESITATTDCGCDGAVKLSEGDKLGLSIAYPEGYKRTVHAWHGFEVAGGLVVRTDDRLVSEWTYRGAPESVFSGLLEWWIGDVFADELNLEVPAAAVAPSAVIHGGYLDLKRRYHHFTPAEVRVSDSAHAALVLAVL